MLNKRALNYTLQEFINEARHEFYEYTKLNPILLITIGGILVFLIIFYFIARCKYPKGRNTVIFVIALMILDFCLDVAFVVNNVWDVPFLFLPSLLTILVPAGFNVFSAFVVMIQQTFSKNNGELFKKWLHRHTTMAGAFTILSMLHIEILKLLTSNLLHLDLFNAPFNNTARKLLFTVGLINVFIEDIPQFVILILYFKGVGINFTFIPLFTLFINFISLLSTAINRIYELISFPSDKSERQHHN
ncbi:hypothetical protein GLOIN_2v1619398 [Rhizophagus clarus]|uniref:Uncharacterized protein n=1 Tax=Rhizophagus clarus TaxID=94130 RepID=A0A8H3MAF1_9GLOM|nr:hypothetical protein GLOIN_2v1619398 [Rhizophagus clarus]